MPSDVPIMLDASLHALVLLTRQIAILGAHPSAERDRVVVLLRAILADMEKNERYAFCDGMAVLEQSEMISDLLT
ncbi:hypothetical protein [Croceicoccus sp. YJ47]|uniref:hypothetical protein n=1 Tax=Croceicoccus sp. YJ47 TaxID=2798724 RepID=UPI0019233685|nr:hypothetical protein [Croceicoccus sp. YJ47]QQN75034.1 hypothetical protein JD971_04880 [Croceicoccus sp. YJ47]